MDRFRRCMKPMSSTVGGISSLDVLFIQSVSFHDGVIKSKREKIHVQIYIKIQRWTFPISNGFEINISSDIYLHTFVLLVQFINLGFLPFLYSLIAHSPCSTSSVRKMKKHARSKMIR